MSSENDEVILARLLQAALEDVEKLRELVSSLWPIAKDGCDAIEAGAAAHSDPQETAHDLYVAESGRHAIARARAWLDGKKYRGAYV
jgi:hypothetical protein